MWTSHLELGVRCCLVIKFPMGDLCVCVCFLSAEFPMPKTELVQKFHVLYLGMTSVSRPIGKSESILKTINTP